MEISDNPTLRRDTSDPTLFCTAYKKNRFYMFTRRDPEDLKGYIYNIYIIMIYSYILCLFVHMYIPSGEGDRDVFNEKPSKEEMMNATQV